MSVSYTHLEFAAVIDRDGRSQQQAVGLAFVGIHGREGECPLGIFGGYGVHRRIGHGAGEALGGLSLIHI